MKNIAAIILAAGYSQRFGEEDKLLADLNGKHLISYVLDQVTPLPFSQRLIVVNQRRADLKALCDPGLFEMVENPVALGGMATSICAGVNAITDAEGAILILGDMPDIQKTTYLNLLNNVQQSSQPRIIAPSYNSQRGHPVFFSRHFFEDLSALSGDSGARLVIEQHLNHVQVIEVDDPGVLLDIDTQVELKKARRNNG